MAVEAARRLRDGTVCFVGIGLPSLAANLARRTHAPDCVLVYESGTIGAKPTRLPLSIGDGELAETADAVVSVPEMFAYWLQGGRIDVGFLGAAQIDRHGNLNSTVIGDYDHPKVRLPGGGGAPEIATGVRDVFVMLRQTPRAFVERLDFTTSVGDRVRVVVTDLGILEPRDGELTLVARASGRRRSTTREPRPAGTLRVADDVARDRAADASTSSSALRALEAKATRRDRRRSPIVLPDDPSFGPRCRSTIRATARRAGARPTGRSSRCRRSSTILAGPVFGEDAVERARPRPDAGTPGEPLGERIIVTGRVLDDDGRPLRGALVEVWQANAGGRYRHEVDQHPAPLDPNFPGAGRCLTDDDGRYRFVTVKPGAYPWGNHENAWRPAHIHFSVFGRAFTQRLVTQMYFPGDPLFAFDPIFNSVRDPKARELLVSRFDLADDEARVGARLPVGHRPRPRRRGTTPFEEDDA